MRSGYGKSCYFKYQKIQFNTGISYPLLIRLLTETIQLIPQENHIAFRYEYTKISESFLRLEQAEPSIEVSNDVGKCCTSFH